MAGKLIHRPEVVHQLKEVKGNTVITKCGVEGRKDVVRTTAWYSETTCDQCQP